MLMGENPENSDVPNKPENSEESKFVNRLIAEQARLQAEKQALIEEFTKSIPGEWSPDDLKIKLKDLLAKAYARLSQSIDNDDEPALAFQAAKFVWLQGIGAIKITGENDPDKELNELLKKLAQPKDSGQATTDNKS